MKWREQKKKKISLAKFLAGFSVEPDDSAHFNERQSSSAAPADCCREVFKHTHILRVNRVCLCNYAKWSGCDSRKRLSVYFLSSDNLICDSRTDMNKTGTDWSFRPRAVLISLVFCVWEIFVQILSCDFRGAWVCNMSVYTRHTWSVEMQLLPGKSGKKEEVNAFFIIRPTVPYWFSL